MLSTHFFSRSTACYSAAGRQIWRTYKYSDHPKVWTYSTGKGEKGARQGEKSGSGIKDLLFTKTPAQFQSPLYGRKEVTAGER